MVEKTTSLLFAAVLLVILLLVALTQTSLIQSEAEKLKSAGTLPGCCLALANPVSGVCSQDDSVVLNFECDVSKDISSTEKMKISDVFKKVNGVKDVTAEQIRQTCQCGTAAT